MGAVRICMKNIIREIKLKTNFPIQLVDITDRVRALVNESGVKDGSITIMTQHTTAALNINEREEGLKRDIVGFLSGLANKDACYIHNRNAVNGRGNAHSHLIALLLNVSETVPISGGRMFLGDWQSIFFIELDGPRSERRIIVQIMGE